MATSTVLMNIDTIFRDNITYLNAQNWGDYFLLALKNGFIRNPSYFYHDSQVGDKIVFNYQRAFLNGQMIVKSGTTMPAVNIVTEAEGDQLIYYTWDGSEVKLMKASLAGTSTIIQNLTLSNMLMYCCGHSYRSDILPGYPDMFLPVCYGVYDNGNVKYWDLGKLIRRMGEPVATTIRPISGSGSFEEFRYGNYQYGTEKIYGGQNYYLYISGDYSQDYMILYPMPCLNLQPSVIQIKNEKSSPVSVRIPKEYNWMIFEYFCSSEWTDDTNYISYTIPANGKAAITMTQITNVIDDVTVSGVELSKSFYKISL